MTEQTTPESTPEKPTRSAMAASDAYRLVAWLQAQDNLLNMQHAHVAKAASDALDLHVTVANLRHWASAWRIPLKEPRPVKPAVPKDVAALQAAYAALVKRVDALEAEQRGQNLWRAGLSDGQTQLEKAAAGLAKQGVKHELALGVVIDEVYRIEDKSEGIGIGEDKSEGIGIGEELKRLPAFNVRPAPACDNLFETRESAPATEAGAS